MVSERFAGLTPRGLIDLVSTIAILITCGILVAANWDRISQSGERPLPKRPIPIRGSAIKGDSAATVAIVEYLDYECPFCKRFASDTLPLLDDKYISKGSVLFVVKHHPIEALHPFAVQAAVAVSCAGSQTRFWELHEELLASRERLSSDVLEALARGVGLDMVRFDTCRTGESNEAVVVQHDVLEAEEFGLTGTPAFVIGKTTADGSAVVATAVIRGSRPFGDFAAAIDGLLQGSHARSSGAMWVWAIALGVPLIATRWHVRRRDTRGRSTRRLRRT